MSSLAGSSCCGAHDITGALSAHHQRRNRPHGYGTTAARIDAAVGGKRQQRAVEPAGIDGAGPGEPALQHILAVEVRTLAIGRRRGMHDGRLLRLEETMQVRHRRIEREEGIERQRWRLAIEQQRAIAAQGDPVGIADRRHGTQPVERAPQHDHQHARIATFRTGELRHLRPGKQGAGADQRLAAAGQVKARGHGITSSGARAT